MGLARHNYRREYLSKTDQAQADELVLVRLKTIRPQSAVYEAFCTLKASQRGANCKEAIDVVD
jgi:hypothetical protein